ncbi:MAG: T9SS type A sorting domain-containing protein [Candidatus Marinimicrobia bacterium]|nr:T9SS type A sorting domain-containing protein [Candidatus Neomarinimicrobiota bacterium]
MDQHVQDWADEPGVFYVVALSDIGQPYSCQQWGDAGQNGLPVIIDDPGTIFGWLHDSYNAFPTYAIIDHNMKIRVKPWTYNSNSNSNECYDIDGCSGGHADNFIQQLLDECGPLCQPCAGTEDSDGDGIGDECDDCHNLLGDVNDDLNHDILDIVSTVNIILAGGIGSGDFTECEETDADMDSNGAVNILDVIQIINLILDNRAIHQVGNAQVGTCKGGDDLHLHIDSEVNFTGFQLRINGEYPNITIENNDHINLMSRVKNGETHVIAYSVANIPFKDNSASINITGGALIDNKDINVIVSSPAGEALTVMNMGAISETVPSKFGLTSVFPNPFNPNTSISFTLPIDEKVKLAVFDVRGNELDVIVDDNLIFGEYTFNWDASDFASGVYYIQLNSASHSSMMKALLMK